MKSELDPFDVLEISRTADHEDVKAAYRRLAMLHHPDRETGDSERFQQIKWAYETLSDPAKRREHAGRPVSAAPPADLASAFGDFFANIEANGRGREVRAAREFGSKVDNYRRELEITLEQAYLGGVLAVGGDASCVTCSGAGMVRTADRRKCPYCDGHGFTRVVRGIITVENECGACNGSGHGMVAVCPSCGGTAGGTTPVSVDIPPGCRDGYEVSVAPKKAGINGRPVTVTVRVKEHERFRRDGVNLETVASLEVWQAAVGARITLRGIDGADFALEVPPGTQPGAVIEVHGKGMPAFSGFGDLRVTCEVRIPRADSGALLAAFTAVRKAAA